MDMTELVAMIWNGRTFGPIVTELWVGATVMEALKAFPPAPPGPELNRFAGIPVYLTSELAPNEWRIVTA